MNGARWGRIVALLLVLAAGAWLGARELHYSRWMDDDAFISFRYARSLAEGHGLTFNADEHVEGYTNFLWTVILACCRKLGADIPRAGQLLGALFSCLTFGVLYSFSRSGPFRTTGVLSVFAILLLCFTESWAVWAVGGLENVFAAFLLALAFRVYFEYLEGRSHPHLRLAAVLFALGAMTHPSYGVFLAVVIAHLALGARRDAEERAALLAFVGLALAIYGPYFAWRLMYYRHLFPNTYYAKVGLTRWELLRGLGYFARILQAFPVGFLSLAALPYLGRARGVKDERPWILLAAVVVYSLYIVGIGGEAFPAYRTMVVLLPLVHLVTQYDLTLLFERGATPHAPGARRTALAVGVAGIVLATSALFAARYQPSRRLEEAVRMNDLGRYRAAALLLKANLPPQTLLAYSGAGVIAYYTGFRFIDILGLTDTHIGMSRAPELGRGTAGHEKGDGAYVLSRRPDYIVFTGYPIFSQRPGFKGERELFALPEFAQMYRLVRIPLEFRASEGDPSHSYDLYLYQKQPR